MTNKEKCRVLQLGTTNSRHQDMLGLPSWKAAWQKKTCGSWWTPSWMWVSSVSFLLRRFTVFLATLDEVWLHQGEMILSHYSALGRPWLECYIWFGCRSELYWKESSMGPRVWWRDWSASPIRRSWESWEETAWRRLRGISSVCINTWSRTQNGWSQALYCGAQEAVATNWNTRGSI